VGTWDLENKMEIPAHDFEMVEIELELSALDYHLNLIEEQIRNKKAFEKIKSQHKINKLNLTPDDLEWHEEQRELDYIVEFLLPRLFRGPFLISLYAVYESAVIEIAKLLQAQKGINFLIKDQKGKNFLDKAKKYYEQTLDFLLYFDEVAWKRIIILSKVRNTIAHANGRIEMLKPKAQENIKTWEIQNIGISSMSGFLVIEERFLRETLRLVSASLNNLVERYKK
jgi:hypothetical protein